MGLTEYRRKRDFKKTNEPKGEIKKKAEKKKAAATSAGGAFVIQKHDASRLHYDFRLELDGVLKSWAVPKGPSLNPADKRLAVQVEDHPIDYGTFEGVIPEGQYGGGTVMLWDRGEWEPLEEGENPLKQWHAGSMKFRLKGERLHGGFALVRMRGGKYGDSDNNWLLIKERDEDADRKLDVTKKYMTSVSTGRPMEEIAEGKKSRNKKEKGGMRVWNSNRAEDVEPDEVKAKDAPVPDLNLDPAGVDGAKKSRFITDLKPQLATLVKSAPETKHWVHEIKFDGYRFLVFLKKGKASLITRNGKDWTRKFPDIAEALERLPVETAILDGELVALDKQGVSRFQLLQNALKGSDSPLLAYYAFDLVYLNGYSLKSATLEDRKNLLRQLMATYHENDLVRFSEHFTQSGEKVWQNACKMGLEGIISKDLNAAYEERRSKSWVKVKCSNRQEFVIGGYTDPTGARKGLGALLVGFHEDGKFKYAGKVGTGFTDASLKEMHEKLQELEQKTNPFDNPPSGAWVRKVHWVKPVLVGEVAYTEMTDEGLLRHPSFQGLREDKKAEVVTVEQAADVEAVEEEITDKPKAKSKTTAKKAAAGAAKKLSAATTKKPTKSTASKKASASNKKDRVAADAEKAEAENDDETVKLTNPQRELFPGEGVTKQDLSNYYKAIEERAYHWMKDRPLTMVRCPEGRGKPCFYQRHNKTYDMPGILPVDVKIKGRTEKYIYMAEPVGLHALVQASTLEIHGWQCNVADVEKPDKMVFDVDPSEEVGWPQIVNAAKRVSELLEACGFKTFPMTTGGKGLHVVVPLKPKAGWDEVIGFAEAIARFLETTESDRYTANMSKAKRVGKVFVDYLRNNKTASAVLPYSTRARPGATVATPLAWSEVSEKLDPKKFTIHTVPKRVKAQKKDPWADFDKERRVLDYQQVIERLQNLA